MSRLAVARALSRAWPFTALDICELLRLVADEEDEASVCLDMCVQTGMRLSS